MGSLYKLKFALSEKPEVLIYEYQEEKSYSLSLFYV